MTPMIKPFLEYVAEDLLKRFNTDMSRIAVVFPNKRASLFLNQHFFQLVNSEPIWTPSYLTISELFRRHSKYTVADPIKQVCDLHKTYIECTGASESIDHFYSWGQLMLSDFDDVDKNMADAEKIFRDISDLAEIEKDLTYLTPEQRAVLKKFFANFTDEAGNGADAANGDATREESELKKRFLWLWQHFNDIYNKFNRRLAEQGLAYEGALYRNVIENEMDCFDEYDTYVFVGFNLLQKVEQVLFKHLKDNGKALFYWDFDDYYMPRAGQQDHEAGHFIAQYLKMFPNALDSTDAEIYKNFGKKPFITIANAATDTVQAAYMSQWLLAKDVEKGSEATADAVELQDNDKPFRIKDGRDTAIVMCDENLLQTVMHSIPDAVDKANITTGFPLQQTAISSFVSQLIVLQAICLRNSANRYRLHDVLKVLRHPYCAIISPKTAELIKSLTKEGEKVYFPSREQLTLDDGLELIFTDVVKQSATTQKDTNLCLFTWLRDILKCIGTTSPNEDALFTESVFRMYTIVNKLITLMESGDLSCDLHTLQRLFGQLISSTSIPFHGEPIEGTQIMGVLETRNLDFTHLLLLSCSEGNMPKGVNDASFIPYAVRQAYGLTTVDHKVAIYAYYFYRMLQRATDVTILSSTVKDTGTPSERSRFITQLMVESGIAMHHTSLNARHKSSPAKDASSIAKTPEIMGALRDMNYLSPTAINRYLKCPLKFYYKNIGHIDEYNDDEQVEIDNRTFGLVFHAAAENIYKTIAPDGKVTAKAIELFVKNEHNIERAVDEAFAHEIFKERSNNFRPEYNGLQLINRAVIKGYIKSLLLLDKEMAPFTICGEELMVTTDFTISNETGVGEKNISIKVGGTIDRLDIVKDKETGGQTIRVVDYKTGVYHAPTNAQQIKSVDEIFYIGDKQKPHSDYYLQTMLYSLIISKSTLHNPDSMPVSPSLLYIQHAHNSDYDPVIEIDSKRIVDIETYRDDFEQNIARVIAEIYNPEIAFYPTSSKRQCKYCPYKDLCNMG